METAKTGKNVRRRLPRIIVAIVIVALAGTTVALAVDRSGKAGEIEELQAAKAGLETRVDTLETEVKSAKQRNRALKTDVDELKTEAADLRKQVDARSSAGLKLNSYIIDEALKDPGFNLAEFCSATDAATDEAELIRDFEAMFNLHLAREGLAGAFSARDIYEGIRDRC